MVSRFGYPSFKGFDLTRPVRFVTLVIIVAVLAVIAGHPARSLLLVFGVYAAWAPLVVGLAPRLRRRHVPARPPTGAAPAIRTEAGGRARAVSGGHRHRGLAARAAPASARLRRRRTRHWEQLQAEVRGCTRCGLQARAPRPSLASATARRTAGGRRGAGRGRRRAGRALRRSRRASCSMPCCARWARRATRCTSPTS